MVTAVELDDEIPRREAPRKSNGRHRRFGAGVDQPYLFDSRHRVDDLFGHFRFALCGGAEAKRFSRLVPDRAYYGFEAVALDHRPPGCDVVDVAVAVDIEKVRSICRREEDGGAADPPERADWRIDAAGNDFLGAAVQSPGFVSFHLGMGFSFSACQSGLTTTRIAITTSRTVGTSLNHRKNVSLRVFSSLANRRTSLPQ